MKILIQLDDNKFNFPMIENVNYKLREAARVILDKNGEIALLHVSKKGFYKLPGGGIEDGESVEDALIRETKEETGCEIKNIRPLGKIIEYKSHYSIEQVSYCFLAEVISEGELDLDEGETDAGFKLIWIGLDEAIELMKNTKTEGYAETFIVKRDLTFLEEAKKVIS